MALAATVNWEIQTGGSDTLNGGAFDPGQTAGMFTDGAATSGTGTAPVFTSASYNFVAGDVGAWVYIASGTNWIPGWYKIASVAANAATLNATIGAAVRLVPTGSPVPTPSTVQGVASVASPTTATWSIDYSQQAARQFAYTDLASAGAGLTVSSAAKPFAKQQVGNALVIVSGTNFTAGRYVIASVAAGVATVLGAANITTGAGSGGTGGQGGALASPGQAGAHLVASNQMFIKTGTYTVTSASFNVAAGCVQTTVGTLLFEGYDTVRGDISLAPTFGTRPTIVASGIATFTLFNRSAGSFSQGRNLILDGASLTSSKGWNGSAGGLFNIKFQNFTAGGSLGSDVVWRCWATGCSTVAPFTATGIHLYCVAQGNTVSGFNSAGHHVFCLSYSNSGGSSQGFAAGFHYNCVAYGNGSIGLTTSAAFNCLAEANTSFGFSTTGLLHHCGAYNNTGGLVMFGASVLAYAAINFVTGTASFFVDPANGNFALNTTAGGGAAARAAGYPGVLPGGLSTGYADIGAVQHLEERRARPSFQIGL
jgi:hypothetical protein